MICPWHNDQEASLVISPDTNLWHCMGACQTGGSVIDWMMKTQNLSFRQACDVLKKGLSSAQVPSAKAKNVSKETIPPLAADPDNQKLLNQVINYYHEILKQSPEALDYLQSRGLNHPELITTFKLGYANRTLSHRLPEKNLRLDLNYAASYKKLAYSDKPAMSTSMAPLLCPSLMKTNRSPKSMAANCSVTAYVRAPHNISICQAHTWAFGTINP